MEAAPENGDETTQNTNHVSYPGKKIPGSITVSWLCLRS